MTTITDSHGGIHDVPDHCNAVVSETEEFVCPWCPPGMLHRKMFRAAIVFSFGAHTVFLCAHHRPERMNAYHYLEIQEDMRTDDKLLNQLQAKAIDDIYQILADVTEGCIDPDIAKSIATKCVWEALVRSDPK